MKVIHQQEINEAIASCGLDAAPVDLELGRQEVKQMLARVRAAANPRYRRRLSLQNPITRNVWVRWCDVEGVDSELPFYQPEDVRKLVRVCIWLARGGTQAQLEAVIIQEEEEEAHAYENAA
ncbi:hypothetical protein HPC62_16150 [Thermoleptolyngbya sichuanensis A183]|uniref:Uncharacterized protein n=1 Tax=Thermoleptolyngbya sichuanensis A183 TaxID=2737172 RepID=A0A6M8BMI5_9CYAN|nr:hypothetical protein [Thermoleptolyngbya sichuanensis]QKD83525.1 hypothetical protein HPC62_16150 [Thermoleptolyngbya sichuanensis A183]